MSPLAGFPSLRMHGPDDAALPLSLATSRPPNHCAHSRPSSNSNRPSTVVSGEPPTLPPQADRARPWMARRAGRCAPCVFAFSIFSLLVQAPLSPLPPTLPLSFLPSVCLSKRIRSPYHHFSLCLVVMFFSEQQSDSYPYTGVQQRHQGRRGNQGGSRKPTSPAAKANGSGMLRSRAIFPALGTLLFQIASVRLSIDSCMTALVCAFPFFLSVCARAHAGSSDAVIGRTAPYPCGTRTREEGTLSPHTTWCARARHGSLCAGARARTREQGPWSPHTTWCARARHAPSALAPGYGGGQVT